MHKSLALTALAALASLAGLTGCAKPAPEGWISPPDAYKMWEKNAGAGVKILDVRTPEEYCFEGHAVMARNIPSQFLTAEYDANRHGPKMAANPHFVEDVRSNCKPEDTLLILCAGGHRAAQAAELLRKEGFAKVLPVQGGFSGDYKQDCACQGQGDLVNRGWQQYDLPWSTWVNPDLIYQRERGAPAAKP
jgi:rhodanese-related sulfurtransferase